MGAIFVTQTVAPESDAEVAFQQMLPSPLSLPHPLPSISQGGGQDGQREGAAGGEGEGGERPSPSPSSSSPSSSSPSSPPLTPALACVYEDALALLLVVVRMADVDLAPLEDGKGYRATYEVVVTHAMVAETIAKERGGGAAQGYEAG